MSHIGLIARHSTLTDTSVPGHSEHHPSMFNTRRPEQHFYDCSGRIPILSTLKERNMFYFHWIRRMQDSRMFKRIASEFQWHSQRGLLSTSRDFKERPIVYKVQHARELARLSPRACSTTQQLRHQLWAFTLLTSLSPDVHD